MPLSLLPDDITALAARVVAENAAAGRTVVPMVVNDNFGTLLSRRGEPRTLRIGLRVEN